MASGHTEQDWSQNLHVWLKFRGFLGRICKFVGNFEFFLKRRTPHPVFSARLFAFIYTHYALFQKQTRQFFYALRTKCNLSTIHITTLLPNVFCKVI